MTPACMTTDELRLWQEANARVRAPVTSVCSDCPLSWARQMRAEGCCNGEPGKVGRPILPKGTPVSHTARYRRDYMDEYRTRNLDWIRAKDRVRKRLAYAAKRGIQSGLEVRSESARPSSPGQTAFPLTET